MLLKQFKASQLKADPGAGKPRDPVASQRLRGPAVGRSTCILREVSVESGGDSSAPSPAGKGAAFLYSPLTFRKLKQGSSFDKGLACHLGFHCGHSFHPALASK